MDNIDLIKEAEQLLNPHKDDNGRLHGDVASVILSKKGNIYKGVCVDTPSWGLCAERSAAASMITNGEYEIAKVIAVWKDDKTNKIHVLPPCGHCRQFIRDISESNLNAEVILGKDSSKTLKELIPEHEWPQSVE
jgi:cytidine deaminase